MKKKNHKNLLLHEGWLPIPFFLNRPHQRKQKGRGEEGGGSPKAWLVQAKLTTNDPSMLKT